MIGPEQLFGPDVLGFQIETTCLGRTNYVNLDHAATTPPFVLVQRGVERFLAHYGSVHRGAGWRSKVSTDLYEQARASILAQVGAPDGSYLLFTGNTTGGMNALAYFFAFLKGKMAVSGVEHSSSWLPFVKAEGIRGLDRQVTLSEMSRQNALIQQLGREQVLRYGVNSHFEFDLSAIEALLRSNRVKALVLTASNNVTGYCPPIKEIGELVHRYGAYFIVDACQYIPHHPIEMVKLGIDFQVASGHKFYAPYGGGFVIGPKAFLDQFLPYEIGGGNLPYIMEGGEFLRYKNQQAHDPGTPNAVGAVAMALALKVLSKVGMNEVEAYERELASGAYQGLKAVPEVVLHVPREHLGTVLTFTVLGQDSRVVAERLNQEYGIGVRAGSFCAYEQVRGLLGLTSEDDCQIAQEVRSGNSEDVPSLIRASLGLQNTKADIDRFLRAMKEIAGG